MRTLVISPALIVLGWTLAAPAFAQDALKYVPLMEKRTDLRLQWIRVQREEARQEALETDDSSQHRIRNYRHEAGEIEMPLVTAQGSPYLTDFQALSNKRSDLRIDTLRRGLDSAFTEWLRREHLWAYRQYLSNIAR